MNGLKNLLEKAERILAVPGEVTTNLTDWSKNPQMYFETRSEMYHILDALVEQTGRDRFEEYVKEWIRKHQQWLQKKFEERVQ